MKKLITLIITLLLFTLPFSFAIEGKTEVNIDIVTNEDIDATIIQEGENVNTDIVCIGTDCEYNIYDGEVYLQEKSNITVNNNNYYDKYVKQGSSFGMGDIVEGIEKIIIKYIKGEESRSKTYELLSLLDIIFVSHKENYMTINNVEYLSNKLDRLEAENQLLKEYLDIEFNKETIECKAAINKVARTGQKVETESGIIVDPNVQNGKKCIKFDILN